MKFNEWITHNKAEFQDLNTSKDLGMETREEEGLLESQLEQWVNKLVGLLHTVPEARKQKLLEKVIQDLQQI
jgi:hypothetical protein